MLKKKSGVIQSLSGKGFKIGIVAGRFNASITQKLLKGAEKTLLQKGVLKKNIHIEWVPGAFEIPLTLQKLARTKKFDALTALGAVIRGDTPHFDYVCKGVASGTMRVMLDEKIPIAFGVLTTDTLRQALDRAGGRQGNKGSEAALVAIEMAMKMLLRR